MSRIIKADNLTYSVKKKKISSEKDNANPQFLNDTISRPEDIYQETKLMVEDLIKEAQKKVEQILSEGKIRSEAMIEESEMEIERKYNEAWNKGYNEGKLKAEGETAEIIENANNLVRNAFKEKEKLINDSEKEILNFVIDTLDKICFSSLTNKEEVMVQVAKYLVDFVKDAKGQVILKVSPKDYPFLEKQTEDLGLLLTTGTLSVKIDQNLNQGHCILISENGILEVDLEENLEKVKAVLQDVNLND